MRYSLAQKKKIVNELLSSNGRSVKSISDEYGIAEQTIYNWLNKAKEGTLDKTHIDGERHPREKLHLLISSRTIPDDKMGEWLRENGLLSEELNQFEQEIRDLVEDNKHTEKQEIKRLKKKNKDLERELKKKEKALAEMAALYTLKKKAEELWGDNEDD